MLSPHTMSVTPKVFQFIGIVAFILLCFAIGEVLAVFLTSLIFAIDTEDVFSALRDPSGVRREMLLTMAFLSGLFRFLLVPGFYLFITDRQSMTFVRPDWRLSFSGALTVVALFVSVIPCVSILIEMNSNVDLPDGLSVVEAYFKKSEMQGKLLATEMLSVQGVDELIVVAIVIAILPGIVEEFFFRGIVQTKLYKVFANSNYAVVVSSALFSFFHFQFYGFIPRLVLGVLLGYLFLRSGNVWYPVIAHVTINFSTILLAYFMGTQVLDPTGPVATSKLLLVPSIVLSAFLIWKLINRDWGRKELTSRAF